MKSPQNTQQKRERILLLLALAVFAAGVINLSLFSFRIDLTSAGAYSISSATKAVMAQARDEVSITYYLSKRLAIEAPEAQTISDFLEEYGAASGGRVKVRIVDPQETGQMAQMERLGLQPYTLSIVEQSQQTQVITYSGIDLQYQERHEVLPLVGQIETLEYDLTSKLSKLITQKQKSVAFLSADPSRDFSSYYSVLSQTLVQNATLRQIQPGEAVGDATVLIVAGSRGFTPQTLKPIDDYLMKGGKILFAADGVFVDIASGQSPVVPAGDNALLKALEGWGVKVEQSLVHDAYNAIVPFQGPQGQTLRRYPQWPTVLAKDTSVTNPVTSRFVGLTLMWTSPLTNLKVPGITVEPLVWTSEKSWVVKENLTIDADAALQSAQMPGVQFAKQDAVYALTGAFASAFPSGGVSPSTRMVVVGSSNFLTDLMKITGRADNANFAANAVDWLAQDDDLLLIKTRAYRDKSLTLLQDAQVRQSAAFALSFVTLLLVPLAVLTWAVVRLLRRRAREQKS